MKRSGYLQQRDARTQMLLDVMQRTMKQYMLDTLLITMHEDLAGASNGILSVTTKETTAHGRVVYINEAHRYFTAEADINGNKLRESFKF